MNTGNKSKKLAHGSACRVYGFFVNCCARVLKSLYNIWYNTTMKNKAFAERRMALEKAAVGSDTCALPARFDFCGM